MTGFLFPDHLPHDGQKSREEVLTATATFHANFLDIWQLGFHDFNTEITEHGRSRLFPITKAIDINNFAVVRAQEILSQFPEVEFCDRLGFCKWYFPGDLVMRFKKADRDHLAVGVTRDQAKAWYTNEPLPQIRNNCTRITVWYQLDQFGTAISDIGLSYQLSPKTLGWWSSLTEPGEMMLPIAPSSLPPIPPGPNPIAITPITPLPSEATGG